MITLTVTSGGCAIQKPFEYYRDPEIMGVLPLQGPRYGSFQLTVNLSAAINILTDDWVSLSLSEHRLKALQGAKPFPDGIRYPHIIRIEAPSSRPYSTGMED